MNALHWPEAWGPSVPDESEVMARCMPLTQVRVLVVGCGKARHARGVLQQHPQARIIGLEPNAALVAGNQARPQAGLTVLQGRGEQLPFADGAFDMVWLLKSLHHIPEPAQALREATRVLRPGGWLYVSEPVYDGNLNDIVRLYNDEGAVRAVAQQALDALAQGAVWAQQRRWAFVQPVHFADAPDFERRMMGEALARLQHDAVAQQTLRERVRSAYAAHQGPDGAHFVRPMLARAFQKLL